MPAAVVLASLSVLYLYRDKMHMPFVKVPSVSRKREEQPETARLPRIERKDPRLEIKKRQEAIIGSLHPTAGEVLKAIAEQDGETTQARIYHATGVPTTSLSRWVTVLEQRGLIETYRIGKLRKIKLTKKFLKP